MDEQADGEARSLAALRGRPVVSAHDGAHLGRVSAVVVDLTRPRLRGVRLRHGGLLDRRWRLAALEDITRLDEAVVLADALALREDEVHAGHLILGRHRPDVVDGTGTRLGNLADVEVDAGSGVVKGLVVALAGRRPWQAASVVTVPVTSAAGWRCGGVSVLGR
jgi:sporulation protein YlmC with PRC-barrel domain